MGPPPRPACAADGAAGVLRRLRDPRSGTWLLCGRSRARPSARTGGWSERLAADEIEPLLVRFEELTADAGAATRMVLGYLGLPSNGAVAPLTVRSSDEMNARWLARRRESR